MGGSRQRTVAAPSGARDGGGVGHDSSGRCRSERRFV